MGHGSKPSRGGSEYPLISFELTVHLQNYGVVPQPIYPESLHSSLSGPINSLLKTKLREHALILRRLSSTLRASTSPALPDEVILATLRARKEELMKEVYTIMTATLGVPVRPDETFVWDYYDENTKAGRWEGTPMQFYKEFVNKSYPVGFSYILHLPFAEQLFLTAFGFLLAHQRSEKSV
jgi:bleomycin hydrolase